MRKLASKKAFSCEKQTCICHKKTLIFIKVSLLQFSGSLSCIKGLKEFHFKLFLALALASGATRPHLGVSEHPPNLQLQGLKIHLCSYCRPNYFSRSAPDLESFLWTDTTFAALSIVAKTPVENEILHISINWVEISFLSSFNILVGMLLAWTLRYLWHGK